jgi:hypothetical protein
MSQSPRVRIVKDFVKHTDSFNIDAAHNHVTNDFVYHVHPNPDEYEDGGYDKAGHKELCGKLVGRFKSFKVKYRFRVSNSNRI